MKTPLFVAGGLLCACVWHANAQDTTANPTAAAPASILKLDSEGPDATGSSMSGAPAALHGKTRAEVYEDLVHSKQDGEAARIQQFYRGN
jgi:hypothetical protein